MRLFSSHRLWIIPLLLMLALFAGASASVQEIGAEDEAVTSGSPASGQDVGNEGEAEAASSPVAAQEIDDEEEELTSDDCAECHEESEVGIRFDVAVGGSVHEGMECLDCHTDMTTAPHDEDSGFSVGCYGCRSCHDDAAEQYEAHGRALIGGCEDMPKCSDCHGSHGILPSSDRESPTHLVNLPITCGRCHEDLDVTSKYAALIDHPIEIYETSVHGKAQKGGIYVAATCNDCHSTDGSAHKILASGDPKSTVNHFNIPSTCGQCHAGIESDFNEGIHGQLVLRGETDSPVCTGCHGEHGIISPSDPRSPVSAPRMAEATCARCHDSESLSEKYGFTGDRLDSFIDSFHGLKSKAGDTHVANCASCHGVHRILPSSDPESTIHQDNLRNTCGDCHPKITTRLASQPIHGATGEGIRGEAADLVEKIYIVAIVIIIGLMVLHWLIDLVRQIRLVMQRRPQIRRMLPYEVWQHTLLMVSFVVLVISGFAVTYGNSWLTRIFFGWEGGFEMRGIVHRVAAVVFSITILWHSIFLVVSGRGRAFLRDMLPKWRDFWEFWYRILFNLGRRKTTPQFTRFSYIEKAEYWALVWGSGVMIVTGVLLWADNWFVQWLPQAVLDVSLVVHFWEAWLASLAILVWHLYSTVFSPHVYPMNPSWITGTMPEEMYRHEHPEHLEQARRETDEWIAEKLARLSRGGEEGDSDSES